MSLRLKPLDQQVVVITGASSGIGLATAIAAADHGASVVLAARSGGALDHIVDAIRTHGGRAHAVTVDVARHDDLVRLGEEAVRAFGRVDTWVNNAGVSIYGRLRETAEADARRLYDVNVWGVINGSMVALRHLLPAGGALINVGSEVSDVFIPVQGVYASSKHAVKGYTDSLRVELADEGVPVSVTLIQPTAVDTPYPEHARNYLDVEPKLPTPMIVTERVADAILDAATRPQRDVKVGLGAKLDSLTARVAPRVADVLSRLQGNRQQRDEPARDPQGALWRPSERTLAGAGRIQGRGNAAAPDRRTAQAIAERDRERARQAQPEHSAARGDAGDRPGDAPA